MQMKLPEIRDKIMQDGKLAFERLVEQRRKENGFIVVSQDGKVVKLYANNIKNTRAFILFRIHHYFINTSLTTLFCYPFYQ
jgi:hypothetical protein